MCGIVGILGKSDVAGSLVDGLGRLEHRGFDSAGIAVLNGTEVEVGRRVGKLENLRAELSAAPVQGLVEIGHTWWATHGAATEANAHPHRVGSVTLVHNGIIENHAELRDGLLARGITLKSDTDTEVVAAQLDWLLTRARTLDEAFADLLRGLVGYYALAAVIEGYHDQMFVARNGSPLAIGYGAMHPDGTAEMFVGSDALALAPFTDQIRYLEDADWAVVRPDRVEIFDLTGQEVTREVATVSPEQWSVDKGPWRHYMRKEIEEQPESLSRLLGDLVDHANASLKPILPQVDFAGVDRIVLVACGTAHYACHVASDWLEDIARLPVEIDIASEYRYRNRPLSGKEVAIIVSQSGETTDTLSALKSLKGKVASRVAVVNVPTSSIAREADAVLDIMAGPEIGVASTKTFTGQVMALLGLALKAGLDRGILSEARFQEFLHDLISVPRVVNETLHLAEDVEVIADRLAQASDMFFLGRGVNYPIALEAALKMKEISYIHAEAYPAGELKHGPIALIDTGTPVVVFENVDDLNEKTASNVAEVQARGADVVRVGALAGCDIRVPEAGSIASGFAYAAVAQLLGYFVATKRGTDVDQPRNLAKSVTVE